MRPRTQKQPQVKKELCRVLDNVKVNWLFFKAQKLIVPLSRRTQMLELIHESHQGIIKCKQRAQDILLVRNVIPS